MTNQPKFWLPMTAATLILLAGRFAQAQETPATAPAPAKSTALSSIFDLLGSNALPSLAGLIQPEKMGVLTDNPLTVRGNQADIGLLSGNETNVLSGNHLFSGITVHIEIHVGRSGRPAAEGRTDKPNRKQKPEKAPKRKTDRRSQQ